MPTEYYYIIIAIAFLVLAICIGVLIWYSDKISELFQIIKAAMENYYENMMNESENEDDSDNEGKRRSRSKSAKRRSRSRSKRRSKRPSKRASRSRSRATRQKASSAKTTSDKGQQAYKDEKLGKNCRVVCEKLKLK